MYGLETAALVKSQGTALEEKKRKTLGNLAGNEQIG